MNFQPLLTCSQRLVNNTFLPFFLWVKSIYYPQSPFFFSYTPSSLLPRPQALLPKHQCTLPTFLYLHGLPGMPSFSSDFWSLSYMPLAALLVLLVNAIW